MTLTNYPSIEQRSPEWFEQRRGIITASVVGQLVTTGTPDPLEVKCPDCNSIIGLSCVSLAAKKPTPIKSVHPSRSAVAANLPPIYTVAKDETARGLTHTLVAERITGVVQESDFISADMMRGILDEPVAIEAYSTHHKAEVQTTGFMRRDEKDWTLGASPDGLVGDDGGVEVKCPRAKGHLRTILADEVPAHHMAQIQGLLLVTGRAWWDFISFHGGMPLYVKRVLPDPKWHAAIVAACQQFETTAAEMVAAYETKTKHMPATERTDLEIGLVF